MAFHDRVEDTTTTTGTGNVTLSGTAPTGRVTFNAAFGTGPRFGYVIQSSDESEWETGVGYLSASTTLVRETVSKSSNANAAVNFSAGTKRVFATVIGTQLDGFTGLDSTVTAVSASTMDLADNARYFTKTASGALTWAFSNVPASGAVVVLLELTNGGTGAQTWPASVKWPTATAPTLTASGVDVLGFITDDGGTSWRGVALMVDSR